MSELQMYLEFLLPAISLVSVILGMLTVRLKGKSHLLFAIATLLLLVSIGVWDRRLPETLERARELFQTDRILLPQIPEGAIVCWNDDHVTDVWFAMKRPNYVSWLQGAGLIFFRDTAMEWKRRTDRLLSEAEVSEFETVVGNKVLPKISDYKLETVKRLCLDPKIDFVVVDRSLPGSIRFGFIDASYFLTPCRH